MVQVSFDHLSSASKSVSLAVPTCFLAHFPSGVSFGRGFFRAPGPKPLDADLQYLRNISKSLVQAGVTVRASTSSFDEFFVVGYWILYMYIYDSILLHHTLSLYLYVMLCHSELLCYLSLEHFCGNSMGFLPHPGRCSDPSPRTLQSEFDEPSVDTLPA